MFDALVIGAGPAGAAIGAALCNEGLRVGGLSPTPPAALWPNTYGIWRDELDALGLTHLLAQRWTDCAVYAGGQAFALGREYGLIDNARLQAHLLAQCARGGMAWRQDTAATIEHLPTGSRITTHSGGQSCWPAS